MGQFSVEKPVLPGSALSGNQHPVGKVIIRARPLRRKDRQTAYEPPEEPAEEADIAGEGAGELDGSAEGEHGGGGTGDGGVGGTGGPEGMGKGVHGGGGRAKSAPARVRLLNVRSVPIGARKRGIAFTPDFSGEVRIMVEDSGADSNYALQVIASSAGTVTQGKIDALKVTAGVRCNLEIELSEDFDGAMRLVADAV